MKNLKQESFIEHNKQYESTSNLSWHKAEYVKNDSINLFESMGFRSVFERASKHISCHIDIGSGGGYLVDKACKYFDHVYGIEPSKAAIDIAENITNKNPKIIFINEGMVDGIQKIDNEKKPFLVTTSAVLSHIDNFHVEVFLSELNKLAIKGCQFYFYEPYDKNIDINLWHVRNKKWWIERLPGWKINFLDIKDSGYKKGIEGEYAGIDSAVLDCSENYYSKPQLFFWNLSGLFYKLRYAISRFVRQ